jgi:LysM repeat protein
MRVFLFRLVLSISLVLSYLSASTVPARSQSRTHIVQAGDTLFSIAQQYGVSVAALRAANSLTGSWIYAGQTLNIPDASPGALAAPPAASGSPVIHIVQPGENLFRIGLKYGVPWTQIMAANNLPNEYVYVGQRLTIAASAPAPAPTPTDPPPTVLPTLALPTLEPTLPPPQWAPTETPPPISPPPEQPAPPAASGGNLTHIVQRGETLFTIGLKYNLSWTTIQAANNLAGTTIFAGQSLNIPTGESAAAYTAQAQAQPQPAAYGAGPLPGRTGKYFLVDLSEQRVYAYEGQTLVRSTLVSTGRWPTPTVTGEFSVYLRFTSTRMRGPGYDLPNVPYTMYFYKGYGLHGTYWHSNFGTPMSHGCVNMPTPEAEWAYYWSTYGTPVIVQQ